MKWQGELPKRFLLPCFCSVEDAMDSATCNKNLAGNLETLRHVAALPRHCSSHSVVKITSFVPLPVLERAR